MFWEIKSLPHPVVQSKRIYFTAKTLLFNISMETLWKPCFKLFSGLYGLLLSPKVFWLVCRLTLILSTLCLCLRPGLRSNLLDVVRNKVRDPNFRKHNWSIALVKRKKNKWSETKNQNDVDKWWLFNREALKEIVELPFKSRKMKKIITTFRTLS